MEKEYKRELFSFWLELIKSKKFGEECLLESPDTHQKTFEKSPFLAELVVNSMDSFE